MSLHPLLPCAKARWIWDGSDRRGCNYYLEARRTFSAGQPRAASLLITADAFYQVWLNGRCLGHGPAKSAGGTRSVDAYDILPHLVPGQNVLEILALSVGVGTMTYVPGEAGLLFELRLDGRVIGSDARVRVRRARGRLHPTVRRWVLPCLEDVDARAAAGPWRPARIVAGAARLYPRRVPRPTREPVYPVRFVSRDALRLPNFSVSFRLKRALVDAKEARLWNHFATPATLRLPLLSSRAQTLHFTPTLGQVEWFYRGRKLFQGSGWHLHPARGTVSIRLKRGRNELVGRHDRTNHFEDISLAGFAESEIEVGPLAVTRDDGARHALDPLLFANAHDLAVGAVAAPDGPVRRTIWDLGHVRNGWISFAARGAKTSRLLLAFFEAMDGEGRIQWADGCNNALTYRLREGWQRFESFFPYGVRYIAVHEIGGAVEVRDLRLLKATCARKPAGDFQTDDALLNGVYRIAAQTLEASTDDTFTDCPTFEQVNWNFDNRLAAGADLWIAANLEIIRNSILLFAEDPEHRGLVASQTPSTWSQRIPLWSFHWIFWCWDYYRHTGDLGFVRRIFPRVQAGIREALGRIGKNGLLEWPGAWHFVEWAHGRDDDHAVNAAEQAGLLEVLAVGDRLARLLGRPAAWTAPRARLRRAIHRHLWNPATRSYADSLHADGTRSAVSSQPTNAMMALYGAADPAWSRQLARTFVTGSSPLVPVGSPLGLYYLLELMDRHDEGGAILRCVRQRWGEMILAGDGTTWEMFSEYGHGPWPTRSRCHPFSAFVVKYLVKYILGVELLAPGFAAVRVRPRPPAGMKQGGGAVPTPYGPLRISWQRRARRIDLAIHAPGEIRILA